MSGQFDVVVVGGGPAGMACATTVQRLGLSTALFERLALGGELTNLGPVAGTPVGQATTGPDLAAAMMEDLMDAGVTLRYEEVTTAVPDGTRWSVNGGAATCRALVLATGREPDLSALAGAADLLGQGVSLCSSCDGPLCKGRDVAVVGSGELAFQMAMELRDYASKVTIVPDGPLRVSPTTAAKAAADDRISVLASAAPRGVVGTPVRALRVTLAGETKDLPVSWVFVATPRAARPPVHPTVVELEDGSCTVDVQMRVSGSRTSLPLYAVGDVRAGSSATVAGAVGDGVTAAWSIASQLLGVRR